jgi:hypothetical protein
VKVEVKLNAKEKGLWISCRLGPTHIIATQETSAFGWLHDWSDDFVLLSAFVNRNGLLQSPYFWSIDDEGNM